MALTFKEFNIWAEFRAWQGGADVGVRGNELISSFPTKMEWMMVRGEGECGLPVAGREKQKMDSDGKISKGFFWMGTPSVIFIFCPLFTACEVFVPR